MLGTLQQWHTTTQETSSLRLEAHADFIQKPMMVNLNEGGITLPRGPFLPQEDSFSECNDSVPGLSVHCCSLPTKTSGPSSVADNPPSSTRLDALRTEHRPAGQRLHSWTAPTGSVLWTQGCPAHMAIPGAPQARRLPGCLPCSGCAGGQRPA